METYITSSRIKIVTRVCGFSSVIPGPHPDSGQAGSRTNLWSIVDVLESSYQTISRRSSFGIRFFSIGRTSLLSPLGIGDCHRRHIALDWCWSIDHTIVRFSFVHFCQPSNVIRCRQPHIRLADIGLASTCILGIPSLQGICLRYNLIAVPFV